MPFPLTYPNKESLKVWELLMNYWGTPLVLLRILELIATHFKVFCSIASLVLDLRGSESFLVCVSRFFLIFSYFYNF